MIAGVTSCITMGLTLCICFLTMSKICLLHEEYVARKQQIESESWLRDKCTDSEFFSRLGQHTNICEQIELTARVGAMWHAINKVSNSLPLIHTWTILQKLSWPFMATTAVVLLLFPSLVICRWNQHTQQYIAYKPLYNDHI